MTKVENSTTKPLLPVAPTMPKKDNSDATKGALSGFSSGVLSTILAGLNSAGAISSGSGDNSQLQEQLELIALLAELHNEIEDGANSDANIAAIDKKIEDLLNSDPELKKSDLGTLAQELVNASKLPASPSGPKKPSGMQDLIAQLESFLKNVPLLKNSPFGKLIQELITDSQLPPSSQNLTLVDEIAGELEGYLNNDPQLKNGLLGKLIEGLIADAKIATAPGSDGRKAAFNSFWIGPYNDAILTISNWFEENSAAIEAFLAGMPKNPSNPYSDDQIKFLGKILLTIFSLMGSGLGLDKKIFGSVFGLMSPSILKEILVAYSYAMAGGDKAKAEMIYYSIIVSLPGYQSGGIPGCPNYNRFIKALDGPGNYFPSSPPSGTDLYFALQQLRAVLANFFGS